MTKRSRIKGHYVERNADGTFKKWVTKAKTHPKKSGYGHHGDYNSQKKSRRKGSLSRQSKEGKRMVEQEDTK